MSSSPSRIFTFASRRVKKYVSSLSLGLLGSAAAKAASVAAGTRPKVRHSQRGVTVVMALLLGSTGQCSQDGARCLNGVGPVGRVGCPGDRRHVALADSCLEGEHGGVGDQPAGGRVAADQPD